MTGSPAKAATKTVTCRLKELQVQGLERLRHGAVFWPYSWRSELCTCTSCKVGHKYQLSDYNIGFGKGHKKANFAGVGSTCDPGSCNRVYEVLRLSF